MSFEIFAFFFFSSRRRHTRLVSDWSSDVCSSDLTHSIFAQDQWRIKRVTLNLGVRFDWFQGSDPAQTVPAQPQYGLPARSFAAERSEERRVGKECRSRWSPDH